MYAETHEMIGLCMDEIVSHELKKIDLLSIFTN